MSLEKFDIIKIKTANGKCDLVIETPGSCSSKKLRQQFGKLNKVYGAKDTLWFPTNNRVNKKDYWENKPEPPQREPAEGADPWEQMARLNQETPFLYPVQTEGGVS